MDAPSWSFSKGGRQWEVHGSGLEKVYSSPLTLSPYRCVPQSHAASLAGLCGGNPCLWDSHCLRAAETKIALKALLLPGQTPPLAAASVAAARGLGSRRRVGEPQLRPPKANSRPPFYHPPHRPRPLTPSGPATAHAREAGRRARVRVPPLYKGGRGRCRRRRIADGHGGGSDGAAADPRVPQPPWAPGRR